MFSIPPMTSASTFSLPACPAAGPVQDDFLTSLDPPAEHSKMEVSSQ